MFNEGEDCLKRIKEFFPFTLDTSFTPEQEKEVLLDIYSATNGQQWYETSGWNSSTNDTSHCSWYGITCHNTTSYIKSIVLAYNNLDGFLPSNIWKIRNLLSLCTPGNPHLRGNIGDFLFGNMSKLLIVHFNGASIGGDIPRDIVKLSNLQNFLGCDMEGDGFSGPFIEEIGNMTEIRLLCFGGNNFTGEISRSISRLKKLYYLDLRNTPGSMHGNISVILALPSLTYLYISGTHLVGELPRVLPSGFRELVVYGNNIKGRLPQIFPTSLWVLNVANNQLTGDIPGDLFSLPKLSIIDLSQNRFYSINKGEPWPENFSVTVKRHVSLAGNRNLSINFPSFVDIFTKNYIGHRYEGPSIINVSFCDITSPMVTAMLYIERMCTLDVRANNFYGPIPALLLDTSILTYLDVSSNNLSGGLPAGIQNLISLQHLDISGNPSMRQGTIASSNLFHPDFSRMTRPPRAVNFTCPEGRLTFNNGQIRLDPTFYDYKYCVCDDDYYGSNGLCKKCMKSGTCNKHDFYTQNDVPPNIMEISSGYWPSPDPNNATHLVKCPVPSACNPSDSCTCSLVTSPKDTHQTPLRPPVSFLTTKCNHSCICHPGSTDRFCSRCQDGFYKRGGLCFRCKKGDLTFYYIFIPIFAVSFLALLWSYFYFNLRPAKWFVVTAVHFLLMLIMMLLELLPAWVFKLNLVVFVLCMTSRGKAARPLISIALFHVQTMDFMISNFNVWPQKVVEAQNYLSSYWNLYFPSLSCDLPSLFTPVGKFAFLLLLPGVCLTMVGLYFIIMLTYHTFRPRRMENVHFKCRQSAFFCLSFSYFPIVKQTLSILRPCYKDLDVYYMPNSPWIECPSLTYHKLTTLGIVSVLVYVVGFPLMVISLMLRFFPKRSSMSSEDRNKLDAWLGPVYLPYKPKYQPFFEIVMLVRRLILAIALSMIPSSSSLQTFVVWLVLMLSAIVNLTLRPYEGHPRQHRKLVPKYILSENVFESVVLLVLAMSFMVLRFSASDSANASFFIWLVMIVNTCVLVSLVCSILYLLVCKGKVLGNGNRNDNSGVVNCEWEDGNERDDDNGSDEERRHLLPSGNVIVSSFNSVNNHPPGDSN